MKIYSKKIVSLIVVFALLFSLCVTTFFASDTAVVNGSVINTDTSEENAGVSNIQIDVYALVPVFTDSNQTDFDKQFAFSVYSDLNGEFSFTKPSAICVVEINEDTVADGYGVLTGVYIISADETTSELKISALATYEIDLEDNSLQFYNAQDEKLTVKENLNASALSDVQLRTTEIELASVLADTELAPVGAPPAYTNEVTYTDGFFTYHYESGTLTNSELNIIRNQFNFTKASLCSTYGYLLPQAHNNNTTYQVYLLDSYSSWGQTFGNQDGSFIVIDVADNDMLTDRVKNSITHELTHAIQFEYIPVGASVDWSIFKESVCECFAMLLSEYYFETRVNIYQNTPELSLLADTDLPDRDYGTFVFALHLFMEFSGFTTIRQIFEEYEDATNLYVAIDNVLRDNYNSNLIETYIDFRIKNYDFIENYDLSNDYDISFEGVQNSPKKTAITEDVVTYTTPMLSTMYFEFEAEVEDYYTFCFALQGATDKNQVNLTGIYTSPDGEQTIIEYPFNSSLKMPNVDMEAGSKICFLMSNINLTETNIQFYTCTI